MGHVQLLILIFAMLLCGCSAAILVQPLASGVAYQASIPEYFSFPGDTFGLQYTYFSVYVPVNVLTVIIDFEYNNESCPLQIAGRTLGLPCPDIAPYNTAASVCYLDSELLSSPQTFTATDSVLQFFTGKNWYFGVGRESADQNNLTCSYTITAYVSTCAANEVDSLGTGNTGDCIPLVPVADITDSFPVDSNSGSAYYAVNITVPESVGLISITFVSQVAGLDLLAMSWGVPVPGGVFTVGPFTGTSTNTSTPVYRYLCTISAPRAGDLTIFIVNAGSLQTLGADPSFTGTLSFDLVVCNAVTAGVDCNGTLLAFAPGALAVVKGAWTYYEFDSTSADISAVPPAINIGLASSSAEVVCIVRREGFPFNQYGLGYDSAAYETLVTATPLPNVIYGFEFVAQDLIEPTRFYLGIYGVATGTINLSASNNVTAGASGTGAVPAATSGQSASGQSATTGGQTVATVTTGVTGTGFGNGPAAIGGPVATLGFPTSTTKSAACFLHVPFGALALSVFAGLLLI